MDFHYEIKNEKLKQLVEKRADECSKSVDRLIMDYIHRGLMNDSFNEYIFEKLHSEEYLKKIDEDLGVG